MRNLRHRRELILRLIARHALSTQEELVGALAAEGVVASQASVSRDIAALGLIKAGGRWAIRPEPAPVRDPLEERVREFLLSVSPAGPNLLVLKTPPGEAQALAYALDGLALAGLVGTVAGDDTVFAAVEGHEASDRVARRLRSLAGLSSGSRRA
ncbi:MAG: arginine repressor [Acidobacteriota bacterium]